MPPERDSLDDPVVRRNMALLLLMQTRSRGLLYIDQTGSKRRISKGVLLHVPRVAKSSFARASITNGSGMWNALPPWKRAKPDISWIQVVDLVTRYWAGSSSTLPSHIRRFSGNSAILKQSGWRS